jgi:hypothetical protein
MLCNAGIKKGGSNRADQAPEGLPLSQDCTYRWEREAGADLIQKSVALHKRCHVSCALCSRYGFALIHAPAEELSPRQARRASLQPAIQGLMFYLL